MEHRGKMLRLNRILAGMPLANKSAWGNSLQLVELNTGDILFGSGVDFDYVYFPVDCIVSLRLLDDIGQPTSFAIVGNEGVTGASIFLGDMSNNFLARVEIGGKAYRLPIDIAIEVTTQSSELRILLLNYMQALVYQSLQTAICDGYHNTLQQIACALLLCNDRLRNGKCRFEVDFIAQSIGVTTQQAKEAITQLERRGFIRCEDGPIETLNLSGLNVIACDCYRLIKGEFDRLLQHPK